MDVQELSSLVSEGPPSGLHCWTPQKLERVFRERTGRQGIWAQYEVPFVAFLHLFPKTFNLFGPNQDFVQDRLKRHPNSGVKILDNMEHALSRLARARDTGTVERFTLADGAKGHKQDDLALPELQRQRFK